MDIEWRDEPEDHDYPAAASYLSLLCSPARAGMLAASLRESKLVRYAAKDILRASELPLLPKDNPHVKHDLAKIAAGKHLSPVLLLRGSLLRRIPLVIADGYHRVCAAYWLDENSQIPARIIAADW